MSFKSGHAKHGGRAKGTPNKLNAARLACEAAGFDPFAALVEIATSSGDEQLRFQASKELAQYIEPKLKAVEHSGSVATTVPDDEDTALLILAEATRILGGKKA